MSYGVKYRLEFSNILGFPKKLEILKKNYSGDVLPIIGSANPVKISWQSSDDFYKPLIGSKCQIELIQTDTISYDEFYKFDEREFKINISYVEPISETYENRVFNDGATVEALSCLENETKYLTNTTFYQKRVFDDGGAIEALNCIENQISQTIYKNYNLYWTGFLVVDRFKEKLTTPPFGIKLNAFDGLGTLNSFDSAIGTSYDGTTATTSLFDLERISQNLQNLDLDLNLNFINDTNDSVGVTVGGVAYNKFPYIRTQTGVQEFKKDFDTYTAKQQLEIILSLYNQRIFQSFGQWYIVESTNIFDKSIKDEILSELTNNSTLITGIRNKIFNQLQSTGGEKYETLKFSNTGTAIETKNIPYVKSVPGDLLPINNDLTLEYLQPAKSIEINTENNDLEDEFFNTGFEYGLTGYDNIDNEAEIVSSDYIFKGQKALKIKDSAPTTVNRNLIKRTAPTIINAFDDIENHGFKVTYFVDVDKDSTAAVTTEVIFEIRMKITYATSGADQIDLYAWDNTNKKWLNQLFFRNIITNTDYNKYKNINVKCTLKDLIERGTGFTLSSIEFEPRLNCTKTTASRYNSTYFDNFIIVTGQTKDVNKANFKTLITQNANNTSIKKFKKIGLAENVGNIYRTRDDFFGINPPSGLKRGPHTVAAANVANDFREFVNRYSGSFRNLNRKPLSINNRLWFNFPNVIVDKQPTVIDKLEFNVKENIYKISAHLPNDDDDIPTTTLIS